MAAGSASVRGKPGKPPGTAAADAGTESGIDGPEGTPGEPGAAHGEEAKGGTPGVAVEATVDGAGGPARSRKYGVDEAGSADDPARPAGKTPLVPLRGIAGADQGSPSHTGSCPGSPDDGSERAPLCGDPASAEGAPPGSGGPPGSDGPPAAEKPASGMKYGCS